MNNPRSKRRRRFERRQLKSPAQILDVAAHNGHFCRFDCSGLFSRCLRSDTKKRPEDRVCMGRHRVDGTGSRDIDAPSPPPLSSLLPPRPYASWLLPGRPASTPGPYSAFMPLLLRTHDRKRERARESLSAVPTGRHEARWATTEREHASMAVRTEQTKRMGGRDARTHSGVARTQAGLVAS